MSDEERAVIIRQEDGSVDLATVPGIVLPSRAVRPMTSHHRLNIQLVQCKAEHAHKVGRKEVDGKWVNLYMHANHQLDGIFMAAGAKVLINEPITSDDQGNPLLENIFRFHFKCQAILPSGKPAEADCYKTWDLRSLDDHGTRAMASFRRRQKEIESVFAGDKYAKWPKGLAKKGDQESEDEFWDRANAFLERAVEDEMIESRVFGYEKAEAGAKSRAVYDLFGAGIKMGVTKEEFEQDIRVVTSIFNMEEALGKIAGSKEGQQLMALMALAQQQAFGAMSGEMIPGGAEALKTLQAVQEMTPQGMEEAVDEQPEIDLGEPIEAQVTEIPAEEPSAQEVAEEAAKNEVPQEIIEKALKKGETKEATPINEEEQGALRDWIVTRGYDQVPAQVNLVRALWSKDTHQLDRLQARITCQYARDVFEAKKGRVAQGKPIGGKDFKAYKDAKKALCRQAYGTGRDLDEYTEWMRAEDEAAQS